MKQEDINKKEEQRMYYDMMLSELYVAKNEVIEEPPVAISAGTYKDYDYELKEFIERPLPIATYGNITFIQAPPKTCKSFLVSLLSTVYLNDTAGKRGGNFRGHREGRGVLHFDTEQSKYHAKKMFSRPFRITGRDFEEYNSFVLRELSANDKLGFIEWYMEEHGENVGLVIIDGIADLCHDTNDQKESSELVQRLMTLTSKYNCALLTVIHTTKTTNLAGGHLGSFLAKKAETVMDLSQNEIMGGQITVKCKDARNQKFEDFDFGVDKYGLPKIITPPTLTNF